MCVELQVQGDSKGAQSLDFGLRGDEWRWGRYRLDSAVAKGSVDSVEGLNVEELSITSGEPLCITQKQPFGPPRS